VRKFTPQKFFLSILNLVSGANNEGYFHALKDTWDIDGDLKDMPVKGALTKKRKRVSFEFFRDEFDAAIEGYEPHRRTWKGLRVYGTDGDQHELPRTEDILAHGYRGYPCANNMETHYLRMYVVHCYDVLGGVSKAFRYSHENDEVRLAVEIAGSLERKSLTLYDRLFVSGDLFRAHAANGSYAIIRCREGVTFTEISEFFASNKRNDAFQIDDITIHLVKIVNPRSGEVAVYATNLPRKKFKNRDINDLYALRWECETANRDLTSTIKIEQWHSESLNGILQELYAAFWLMNQARIQMAAQMRQRCSLKSLFSYAKANFKLIADFIIDSLDDLVHRRYRRVQRRLKELIDRSTERRQRRSRSYPRQVKYSRKTYPSASLVSREAK
jgi:IS4 transposase